MPVPQLVSRLQPVTIPFLCTGSKFPSPLASTAAGLPYVVRAEPLVIPEILVCCTCRCIIRWRRGMPRDGSPVLSTLFPVPLV